MGKRGTRDKLPATGSRKGHGGMLLAVNQCKIIVIDMLVASIYRTFRYRIWSTKIAVPSFIVTFIINAS